MRKIVIIGAGGHARVIIDIIKKQKAECTIELLDDNIPAGTQIMGCEVVGRIKDCIRFPSDTGFIIGIGNNKVRSQIANEYNFLNYVSFIHPKATIAEGVSLGNGCVVMGGAVINSNTKIGNHAIINTAATIDHDNFIGDFVHLSPGVHTGGNVVVGDYVWVGIGAVLKNGIGVCAKCMIGAGSVVVKDIEIKGVYVGVPANLK